MERTEETPTTNHVYQPEERYPQPGSVRVKVLGTPTLNWMSILFNPPTGL